MSISLPDRHASPPPHGRPHCPVVVGVFVRVRGSPSSPPKKRPTQTNKKVQIALAPGVSHLHRTRTLKRKSKRYPTHVVCIALVPPVVELGVCDGHTLGMQRLFHFDKPDFGRPLARCIHKGPRSLSWEFRTGSTGSNLPMKMEPNRGEQMGRRGLRGWVARWVDRWAVCSRSEGRRRQSRRSKRVHGCRNAHAPSSVK